jgi:nucleoside triphosphatase
MAYPEPIAGALIVNENSEILLIESPKWSSKYTIPGGHIEIGETIEDAIKREVKEEVGLDVEFKKILLVQDAIFSEEFHKRKHFIFLECICESKGGDVKTDHKEAVGYLWTTPEKALELDIDTFTRKFIEKYLEDSI